VELLSELVGQSASIVAVREQVRRLIRTWSGARRPPPILIQGETGTGKGLLARAIHRASPRASAPFVDINCAAVPETLLEAELFGYERGAFTDAKQSKPGLFLLAHRGTLFLDEIALMPAPLQAKLLSVLGERAVRPLGATRAQPVDVWVIAATNEDLAQALRAHRFRDDLYHRLAVVSLSLPPLRARGDDIVTLAEHFLASACRDYGLGQKTFTSDARGALVSYPWPGNVRELSNAIERAALRADTLTVDATHLALVQDAPEPSALASGDTSSAGAMAAPPVRSSRDAMHEHLERVLAQTGWNISRTAALLGVSRNTVMARIARFGLRGPRKAGGATVSPPLGALNVERPPVSPPRAPNVARWERRRLTFVRVQFPPRAGGEVEPSVARHLEVAAEKFRALGARVEGGGPSLLLAIFGLDERDEPAVLAGHGALVVRDAARHGADHRDAPALRVGLHTVELFVRAGATAPTLDADGSREAWNAVAAALQLGAPGSIVATASAASLLRRRFALAPLGPDAVAYRVDGLGRTDVIARASHTFFVGRREELALLQSRLAAAIEGRGEVVNLVGEAGMGKSRLLAELAEGVRPGQARYVEGRCLPSEVQTPFAPLLQILRTLAGVAESDESDAIRAKVAAALNQTGVDDADVLGDLVRLLDAAAPAFLSSGGPAARPRLFAAIRHMLAAEAARAPLLLVVEDLHWIDPSSEAYLSTLVHAIHDLRILLIASHRPEYRAPWASSSHVVSLVLSPLSDEESLAVIRAVVPAGAGSVAAEAGIKARAEGNPLFLEELSRGVVEGRDASGGDIPATVDDAISGRLARLGPRPRRVVSGLAVIGRDATAALARAVLDVSDDVFQSAIDQLRRADFLDRTSVEGEPGFTFRHALVQEAAYARVQAAERRALHVRVLDTIERLYPDRDAEHVERLAHHAMLGDAHERAVAYLLRAGEKALARAALAEGLVHFERGLSLVSHLPAGAARDRQEFELEKWRGRVLMATKGYAAPDTERAHARARELGQRVGDVVKLGPVLAGQWAHCLLKAQYQTARAVADELLALARQDDSVLTPATGHRAVGMTQLMLGEFVDAREQLEEAVAGYRPEQHHARALREYGYHPHAVALSYLGRTLSFLGYEDQALGRSREAVHEAERWTTPLGVAQTLAMLTAIHRGRRDMEGAWEIGEKALAYATDKGIAHWIVVSTMMMAWLRGLTDPAALDASIADLRRGIDQLRATGTILCLSEYLTYLAEVYAAGHRLAEAVAVVDEAEGHAEATGEHYCIPDILRLRGELLLMEGSADAIPAAEACFRRALERARAQRARAPELRVATSYARLLQRRGAPDDAHALLAPLYAWFTEGFETAHLRAARAVLDATAGGIPS
jgi:DNA-binding NtrC family response regulator/predicted ATPase/ABC-type cobalamin transport system ATPase subunit